MHVNYMPGYKAWDSRRPMLRCLGRAGGRDSCMHVKCMLYLSMGFKEANVEVPGVCERWGQLHACEMNVRLLSMGFKEANV